MAQNTYSEAPESRSITERLGGSAWILVIIVASVIGYVILWTPVPYADDYESIDASLDSMLRFVGTGTPRAINRLMHGLVTKFFFANDLVLYEVYVAAGAVISALLIGWLARRVLRSGLAGLIASWLFIMPFFAFETLLWSTANNFRHNFPLFLGIHAFLTAFLQSRRPALWIGLGVIGYTLSLLQIEHGILIIFLLPVLAWAIAIQHPPAERRRIYRTAAISVGALIAVTVVYLVLFFVPALNQPSSIFVERGSFDLNPVNLLSRLGEWIGQTYWITLSPGYGAPSLVDAYRLGASTLVTSPQATLLFVMLGVLIIVSILLMPRSWLSTSPASGGSVPTRSVIILAVGSAIWGIGSIFFPGILLADQAVASRFLYIAFAGLSISIGSLVWLLCRRLRRAWVAQLSIGVAGTVLLLATMSMAGYGQLYDLRYARDLQQISGLVKAAPPQALPSEVYLLPYNMDEYLTGQPNALSDNVVGIFEAYWSTAIALKPYYDATTFQISRTNRWGGVHGIYSEIDGEPSLTIEGRTVPIRQILPFTFQGGSVSLIPYLRVNYGEGQESQMIEFPLVRELRPDSNAIDNSLALDVTVS